MERHLGTSVPDWQGFYEIFVTATQDSSVVGDVWDALNKAGIHVTWAQGQVGDDATYIVLYAKSEERIGPDMLSEVRGLPSVLDIKVEDKKEMLYESFMFPITTGGGTRVSIMPATQWIALLKLTLEKFGSGGATILYEQGVSIGKDLAEKLTRRLGGSPDRDTMMENLKGLMKSSGRGILKMSGPEDRIGVEVTDTLVAYSGEALVDYSMVGMVETIVEKAYSAPYVVKDARYADKKLMFTLVREG
ncbi:MAG: hypothetical protein JRN39_06175 [Nitrososphaerota archaeon]|nr:hypothetical protein [Nitrososphaerota archaeon]MDG6939969.1 hypothetical protein [Nitrososphaerota archaeon]